MILSHTHSHKSTRARKIKTDVQTTGEACNTDNRRLHSYHTSLEMLRFFPSEARGLKELFGGQLDHVSGVSGDGKGIGRKVAV